mmetsp:Transcript_20378/g.45458  ORF Transcript_20378/g.45458 Transcript_20378/m.45458 type:complete len:108 (-) Transcript_20378:237-560(-)
MMTLPPLEDLSNLIDEHSNFPTEADLASRGIDERIPPVIDLPITYINKVQHSKRRSPKLHSPPSWPSTPLSTRRNGSRPLAVHARRPPSPLRAPVRNPRRTPPSSEW